MGKDIVALDVDSMLLDYNLAVYSDGPAPRCC